MNKFIGDLSPISKSPLIEIEMNKFNGELTPLSNCLLGKNK